MNTILRITMKTFISITIGFVFFANLAVAQMTTFSQGDILSAGAMNQNFKHLPDFLFSSAENP